MAKKRTAATGTPEPHDMLSMLDSMQSLAERIEREKRGAAATTALEVLAVIRRVYRELGELHGRMHSGNADTDTYLLGERLVSWSISLGVLYQRLVAEHVDELTDEQRSIVLPKLAAAERTRAAKHARSARAAKNAKRADEASEKVQALMKANPNWSKDAAVVKVAEHYSSKSRTISSRTIYRWCQQAKKKEVKCTTDTYA